MRTHGYVLPTVILFSTVSFCNAGIVWDSGNHVFSDGEETIAQLNNDATLQMLGGRIQTLTARHTSYVLMEGGAIENFQLEDSAWAEIKDGTSQGEIWTHDDTSVSVEGGQLHWIKSYDTSVVILKNGELEAVFAQGESCVEIRGGIISERLVAREETVIDIYGYGFSYNPQAGKWDGGKLTGFWENDTPFSIELQDWYGDRTFGHINLHVVPEPASLTLLVLGCAITMKKNFLA
jgi:hypothetical protein